MSGESNCEPYKCFIAGQCAGAPPLNIFFDVPEQNECLAKCKEDVRCQWFSYFRDSKVCETLVECPTIDETEENCVSGENECSGTEVGKEISIASTDPKSRQKLNSSRENIEVYEVNL